MNSTDKVFSLFDAALGVLDPWEAGDPPDDITGGYDFIEGQLEVVGRMLLWSNAIPPLDGLDAIIDVLAYEARYSIHTVVMQEEPLETAANELARRWTLALFDGGSRIDIDRRGVVELPAHHPRATTCGTCGRSWDDAVATSVTPTPSGRCPFEGEHEHGEEG